MYLKHLALTNFRNYARLEVDLQARIYILQGANAQGKTNLLEAIYYLATTRSPLASTDRQLIAWTAESEVIPYARVEGIFARAGAEHTLEVTLVKERPPQGSAETAIFRRQIRLDGNAHRALDVVGKLNIVLFLPEDIALVAGAPEERRHYLDVTLCQIDPAYCRALSRYNRVLTQRNALLRQIREGQANATELGYWDEQLAKLGAYVLARRLWAIAELGRQVDELQPALTGGQEHLSLTYQSTISQRATAEQRAASTNSPALGGETLQEERIGAALVESALEEAFYRAFQRVRREELARGVTVVGPHRDDITFLVNGNDMTTYGSRGQQRTVALALKLAEVNFMEQQTGEMPVLLLDDVVSELDQQRCTFLLDTISRAQQVLITTTDLHYYCRDFTDTAILWQVIAGKLACLRS
jgi:DNA replication and repair protein RecF